MPTGPSDLKALARRNGRIALICAVVFAGMVGAASALRTVPSKPVSWQKAR